MLSLPGVVTEVGITKGLSTDVLELALHAGIVVKLVLLMLLFFSVLSWLLSSLNSGFSAWLRRNQKYSWIVFLAAGIFPKHSWRPRGYRIAR